jgi:hypothetical protein
MQDNHHRDELGPLPVRDPIAIVVIGIFIAVVTLWVQILGVVPDIQ